MAMVRCATHIVLLDGWERSDGAVAEYALAKKLHITLLDRECEDHVLIINTGLNPSLLNRAGGIFSVIETE